MRVLARLLAILIALPLLLGGFSGLRFHLNSEDWRVEERQRLREGVPPGERRERMEPVIEFLTVKLEPIVVCGPLIGVGLLLLGFGAFASGAGSGRSKPRASGAGRAQKKAAGGAEPRVPTSVDHGLSKKEVRRLLKLARSVEGEHGPEAAGDLLQQEGLVEEAAELFRGAGLLERVAEVRHDQNRFEEAGAAYEEAGCWDAAGSIYQQIQQFEKAAHCYVKAEKLSVAGEMFERGENHREAGNCFRKIGFHRQAAEAFLLAGAELDAAHSLVEAFSDEGGGKAAKTEQSAREQRGLAKKAGELLYKLERFDEAEQILVRAGAFAQAGKVAFHTQAYDRAAELFLRVGRGDLAAKALEKLDDPTGAARALGQYLRDQGELAEAVPHLEKAGEHQEAGDLHRQLENYGQAGECYMLMGDCAAAAEMFVAAGDPRRAAEAYERDGAFAQAAQFMGEAGESGLQAQLMEKAEDFHAAGLAYAEQGQTDEAIRVLQLVEPSDSRFADVCAVLGRLFQEKGQHGLSVKKFEEATADQPVLRENVTAYHQLAQAYEASGNLGPAVEIFEKIMAFDYHYEDISERIEQLKAQVDAGPPTAGRVSAAAPDRYQVVREIGRGGMGVVYLAHDSVLERDVAYKVLPEQLRENPNALRNFLREAKAAAQLNHPNIVTVYDAGESEHGFYLAMELVEGTTLKEIVRRRGAVSANGVLYILRQMSDALAYAHSRKVVHRDIKTANTMWTAARQVKIMDFGLAKVMAEVRNATTVVSGTPFYMSPEQTLGQNVDHRTDIYSLGVTLFELATGDLPFRKGNVPYHHVHTAPPEPRSVNENVPEGLEAIILRCLAKAPEDRYQTAGELSKAATALQGGGAG